MAGGGTMSLENLLKIYQLQRHTATAEEVQRLLAAAQRNLADSAVQGLSDETRFDAAYKAIMQCAMVGLLANGYRPSTTTHSLVQKHWNYCSVLRDDGMSYCDDVEQLTYLLFLKLIAGDLGADLPEVAV
jgi:hypothetical protein